MPSLVIQLLTFRQDLEILDLLEFPISHFGEKGRAIRCKLLNFDGVQYRSFTSLKQARSLASKSSVCELALSRSRQLTQTLIVSPTSSLWHGGCGLIPFPGNPSGAILSFLSYETSIRFNEISTFPSLLVVEYNLGTRTWGAQDAIDLIVENLPYGLVEAGISGAADFVGGQPKLSILSMMSPWLRGVHRLREYPDELHDVIIAPGWICREIASVLGEGQIVSLGPSNESLTLLGLPAETVRSPEAQQIVAPLLVPRNATTEARLIGQSPGEVIVGGNVLLTARRRAELEQKRCLVPVAKEMRMDSWSLVEEKYCLVLGIDPGDMLTSHLFNELALSMRKKIDQRFFELLEVESTVDRIWQAHHEVIAACQVFDREVLAYLGRHYFSQVNV